MAKVSDHDVQCPHKDRNPAAAVKHFSVGVFYQAWERARRNGARVICVAAEKNMHLFLMFDLFVILVCLTSATMCARSLILAIRLLQVSGHAAPHLRTRVPASKRVFPLHKPSGPVYSCYKSDSVLTVKESSGSDVSSEVLQAVAGESWP